MGDIDFEKHAREISPCGVIKLGDDECPNKSQFGTRLWFILTAKIIEKELRLG